jgi:alpha-beta hydrolase superfamily lysophospholipase
MTMSVARFAWSSMTAACVLLIVNAAAAADVRVENLRAVDGHPLTITYYPVSEKMGNRQDSPVVVLLHGSDQKGRILWDKAAPGRGEKSNFAQSLNEDGYAVVTVDLRKFGDSKGPGDMTNIRPDDYEKMSASDMFAVKQFLYDEHQKKALNMNKMAIVAAGPMTPVALNFAAADAVMPPHDDAPVLENKTPRGQDVRAIVLLSPEMAAGRLNSTKALNVVKTPAAGIAMLIVAGAQYTGYK